MRESNINLEQEAFELMEGLNDLMSASMASVVDLVDLVANKRPGPRNDQTDEPCLQAGKGLCDPSSDKVSRSTTRSASCML